MKRFLFVDNRRKIICSTDSTPSWLVRGLLFAWLEWEWFGPFDLQENADKVTSKIIEKWLNDAVARRK